VNDHFQADHTTYKDHLSRGRGRDWTDFSLPKVAA